MLSLGLIGYPLERSLSPLLHMAALNAMRLKGEYRLYTIPPIPEGKNRLSDMIGEMRRGEIQGLNVTIPHKQSVMPYLEALTPQAAAIGAVNTIFFREGQVVGDNTDAPGFLVDLKRVLAGIGTPLTPEEKIVGALVIGAGGAARAVVYALWKSGLRVTVAARRLEQAQSLIDSFVRRPQNSSELRGQLTAVFLGDLRFADHPPQIIINASSAGMLPDVGVIPWPDGLAFPEQAFVYDLVYKPAQTAFLSLARSAGLHTANGIGMLVEQAALSLERWTGLTVPRQPMNEALKKHLQSNDLHSNDSISTRENS
jgi:shikimate dehydrogenase